MSHLQSWNEAYDLGRAQLGMDEDEAEAYANEHFVNPDAIVEEMHAQPLDDEAISQREHRARRARAEGWPREGRSPADPTDVGMLPGYLGR